MEIYIDELSKEYPHELDQQFSFQETIASGAFGTVFRAIETTTKREVAIKVINKSGAKVALLQKLKQEVSILKQLKHENIVDFLGYIETNTKLYIMMELIKCGTLKTWIQSHKGTITEEEASTIINHLLSAVCYLHSRDICHRDIKPENVMLNNTNDLTSLKLIDFGLSQQHFDYLEESDYCGTMLYMAPEQIEKKTYTKTVDIWAIGVIMFMLLNKGKHPFYNKGDKRRSYVNKIKVTKVKLFNKCSQMASVLLFKLLEPNPSWRYTADKAFRHPWITRCLEDEVPETFNETLKKRNLKKKLRELMTISIFLNKKTKEHSPSKTFLISSDYVNKVSQYDKRYREKMIRLREKSFEVISSEPSMDSLTEHQEKAHETGRKQSVNGITIDSIKVKGKGTNHYLKLAIHPNAPLVLQSNIKTTTNKGGNGDVHFPIIAKSSYKTTNNEITLKRSTIVNNNRVMKSQADKMKDNYVLSSTKIITVPKIKNTAKPSMPNSDYGVPLESPSQNILRTEPNQQQIGANPTRNIGKSTEPRNKTVNKLVLSTTSPRKVNKGIPLKYQSNVLREITVCHTEENISIVPLILPNISLNHIQRCRIGNS